MVPKVSSCFVDCHVFRHVPDGQGGRRTEWLVLERAPGILLGGTWQMVSGHIEAGETAYQAAARELAEETGLRPVHFYQASYVNRFYLAASDEVILSPVFAAEAAAESEVALSEEHTRSRWVTFEEARELYPWPGQKESITIIRDQFVLRVPRPESCIDHLLREPKVDRGAALGL